ncbi:hypothetical protein V6N13_017989 [Hibiscus sabdariffa]|uniref:Protein DETOXIFICATION n=1 Tax=Hibiscus sabdariffa TaxID=183260 RepID=A0ABR2CGV8_9ROSI
MITMKTLTQPPLFPPRTPNSTHFPKRPTFSTLPFPRPFSLSSSLSFTPRNQSPHCIGPTQELNYGTSGDSVEEENGEQKVEVSREIKADGLVNRSIWMQMKEIVMFTGPATGLWLCGPLMSLIDTAVVGQGSSVELAALGPATVVCDYIGYIFMFLSVATSNMVATSLARRDKDEVQHQISMLLFIGLFCGLLLLFLTFFFGSWALTGNIDCLGMKDSWGPLKALAVASVINGIGDVVLCMFLGYGIAGAAWATMVSQVVAAYMMIDALNKKGYNAFAISIPSFNELLSVLAIAGPVVVTLMSKVVFYSLLIYFATSMGIHTVAAHQVMLQIFAMCGVWGEPLSQTAQSFMPELIYGVNRSLPKARMLLKSLVTIGAALGLVLGIIGTSVPWFFPNIFTPDIKVIHEMHKVLLPCFLALVITPSTVSLEGTLLAGRDLRFISSSMSGCVAFGALILPFLSARGFGLTGCWFALVGFQWARFSLALHRLLSPNGILYSEDSTLFEVKKMRAS